MKVVVGDIDLKDARVILLFERRGRFDDDLTPRELFMERRYYGYVDVSSGNIHLVDGVRPPKINGHGLFEKLFNTAYLRDASLIEPFLRDYSYSYGLPVSSPERVWI